jgi:hypothetical protein
MAKEPYDYHAAVVGMLTLRVNADGGSLSAEEGSVYYDYFRDAAAAEGKSEADHYVFFVMAMAALNAANQAIGHLAAVTEETQDEWLQRIAGELRDSDAAGEEN